MRLSTLISEMNINYYTFFCVHTPSHWSLSVLIALSLNPHYKCAIIIPTLRCSLALPSKRTPCAQSFWIAPRLSLIIGTPLRHLYGSCGASIGTLRTCAQSLDRRTIHGRRDGHNGRKLDKMADGWRDADGTHG